MYNNFAFVQNYFSFFHDKLIQFKCTTDNEKIMNCTIGCKKAPIKGLALNIVYFNWILNPA